MKLSRGILATLLVVGMVWAACSNPASSGGGGDPVQPPGPEGGGVGK